MGMRNINRNMPDMQAPAGGPIPKFGMGKGGRMRGPGGTVAPVGGLGPGQTNKLERGKDMKAAGAIPNTQGGGPVPPNTGVTGVMGGQSRDKFQEAAGNLQPHPPMNLSPEIMAQIMQLFRGQGR